MCVLFRRGRHSRCKEKSMFKRFTNACVRVVNRWLPDAFLFAVILTFVVYVAAMFATGMGPIKVLAAWGNSDGFWGLLAFSMQMALVLVLGSAMASAKICKRALGAIASLAKDKKSAILITTFVSTICCWPVPSLPHSILTSISGWPRSSGPAWPPRTSGISNRPFF